MWFDIKTKIRECTLGPTPPSPLGRPIFFSKVDAYAVYFPHNDALVIIMHICCCRVLKILVDGGSSVNVLYGHTLDQMEGTPELTQKMILPYIWP